MSSIAIVATSRPSMPRQSAAMPPTMRADDLADGEEDAVQAHDRAAVGREPLGDVGQEAERGRRRAGEHEQPDRRPRPARRCGTTNSKARRRG